MVESFGHVPTDRHFQPSAVTRERALRVLDVPAAACTAEVRLAYLDLVRVWHPDRFDGDARLRAKAGLRLAEINVAYRRLTAGPPRTRAAFTPAPGRPFATEVRSVRVAPSRTMRGAGDRLMGVAATAALLFGVACVALALILTPVV